MVKETVFAAVREQVQGSRIDLCSATEFAQLSESAAAASPTDFSRDPMLVKTWSAMALFGPVAGIPADEECELLKDISAQYCTNEDDEALLDVIAAYGCGWKRGSPGYEANWSGIWPGAFTYLTKRSYRVCRRVLGALQQNLHVRFPNELQPDLLLHEAATLMSTMLVQPVAPVALSTAFKVASGDGDGDPIYARLAVSTDANWEETIPTGARAVYQCTNGAAQEVDHEMGFGAGDTIRLLSSETLSSLRIRSETVPERNCEKRPTAGQRFEFNGNPSLDTYACTCGEADCAQRHRLSAWDPREDHESLQNFLYSSIRGRMQALKAKDFAQGLLGSYWARHGFADGSRLRLAEVVHQACMLDDCRHDAEEDAPRAYLGDRCDRCGAAADPATPLVARERLVFVDTRQPEWEFREYWRCGQPGCGTPELDKKRNTLLEPTAGVLKKAAICQVCNQPFWPAEQNAMVGRCFSDAKTLLEAVKKLEKTRRQQTCSSCGKPGATPNYCRICERDGRAGKLPARPTWYFTKARP